MKIFNIILFFIFFLGLNYSCFSQKFTLDIYAKDSVENTVLKKISFKKEKLNENLINNQIDSISSKLSQLGYLNFEILSTIKKDSTFSVNFILNKQIKSISITTSQNNLIKKFIKENDLHTNNNQIVIPYNLLNSFMNKISIFYEQKGYSFTKIKLKNHLIENDTLYTELAIKKNLPRRIDKLIINGYDNFPKNFLKFHLNRSTKNTFNKESILKISKNINTIPFVKQIKKPEVLFLKDSTLIYIYLKKKKTSQFDGLIGFTSNKQSKLIFNGHLNLKLNNIFNKGELIELLWKSTSNKNKDFNILVDLPYIFNSRINPKTNFSIYSQDSSFINIKSKTILNYAINNKHKIGLITIIENSKNTLKNKNSNIKDFSSKLFGLNYSYNLLSKNNFYENKSKLTISLLNGKKTIANNHSNKSELLINISQLINLNKKSFLFIKNATSANFSNNILNNELYKIGGEKSIRGFKEKSIPSSKHSVFNIDYNYKISYNTYIYTISDFALSYNKEQTNLYSIGIGYKIKLRSSILKVNYSVGTDYNTSLDIKNALLNISYINYF